MKHLNFTLIGIFLGIMIGATWIIIVQSITYNKIKQDINNIQNNTRESINNNIIEINKQKENEINKAKSCSKDSVIIMFHEYIRE